MSVARPYSLAFLDLPFDGNTAIIIAKTITSSASPLIEMIIYAGNDRDMAIHAVIRGAMQTYEVSDRENEDEIAEKRCTSRG